MLPFHTLDVFTTSAFVGNPLAVVLDADGLSTGQMQTIAREFNLSETIFVMRPNDPAHDASVRIFFPTAEIPFAGHPTVGCAILLASLQFDEADFDTEIVLEEVAGRVPVRVTRKDGTTTAEFVAPIVPHPYAGEAPADLVAAALGLPASMVGYDAHAPGLIQGGPAFLLVPVKDVKTLGAAHPVEPHWTALMERAGVDSAYLYTTDGVGAFRTRMFSPTAGIPEDPATGSAATMLAGQLLAAGALAEGENRFTIRQGVEMGRPSLIRMTANVQDGALREVRIAGNAVPISEGRIRVPA